MAVIENAVMYSFLQLTPYLDEDRFEQVHTDVPMVSEIRADDSGDKRLISVKGYWQFSDYYL